MKKKPSRPDIFDTQRDLNGSSKALRRTAEKSFPDAEIPWPATFQGGVVILPTLASIDVRSFGVYTASTLPYEPFFGELRAGIDIDLEVDDVCHGPGPLDPRT
jgi:hypothetical protein